MRRTQRNDCRGSRVDAGETALSGELLVLISSIAEGLDVAVQVIPARVTRCSYRPTAGPQANAGKAAIADIDGRHSSPAVV